MVQFDGNALEDISSDIRVIDVTVSAPGISNTMIQPTHMDGDIFARTRYMRRTINIAFVVMQRDMALRMRTMRDIYAWARSSKPKALKIPQEPDGYLMAVCSALPNDSAREYWQPLSIEFVADDPYFQSNNRHGVDIHNGVAVVVAQYDSPNWLIQQTVTQTLVEPMWGVGSSQISFQSIPAGLLNIKRDGQSADVDGNSIMPSMMLGSRFFDLKAGTNIINVSGGAAGQIVWTERWL